ncbi:glycoside hydrolase superfamily [Clohesyomyces aquaticus]|uniref:Alpha-amylase n=1 Tax=Clohesyomyces aquaticus TaxID=1231657 RepID=A0A1Y1YK05_9PLEO|nr:glycoside hydrolase superfamily [Clohesyomyces aquaticus]
MKFISSLLAFSLNLNAFARAADTAAWRSRSIYFALTDRMARSSGDTGGSACGDLTSYCGGTFKGLESKLDYVKGLGLDAIWITPVVANKAGGYHGYWAQDLNGINSNYGTAADLKSLVSTAHSKGIYVMVDVVANHMGPDLNSISQNAPSPLNQASSYHSACTINYAVQSSVEQCEIANLPDVDTTKTEIRTLYQNWIKSLVGNYSFDGVRIDTVKHVEKDFWPGFSSAAGVYSIGEVFDGDPAYVSGYASLMPGLLNYPIYYPMNNFYQQKGSAQAMVDMHNTISNSFPDPTALGTFLDNHDNPRWLNQKNDASLLKNALAYVILSRGIPIVYYGTEQGYSGGADPANREDLWRSNFNTNSDLYKAIAKLTGARKSAGGLAGNDQVHLYVASNAYAWSRAGGNLVVLTVNTGLGTSGQYCFNTQKVNGKWTNVYGSGTFTSDGNGNICVSVTNGEPVVLVATESATTPTTTIASTSSGTVATTLATAICPSAVSVTFNEKVTTNFGDSVKIAGNNAALGNWNAASAPGLSAAAYTASNPVWSITLSLSAGQTIQYKFLRTTSSGTVTWESDPNRSYTVPSCQASSTVTTFWQ